MNIYRLYYRNEADFYEQADELLKTLVSVECVNKRDLFVLASDNPDLAEMIEYLSDKGLATVDERDVGVSSDGRLFVARGGFKGKTRRKVTGAVAGGVGAAAAIATILALLV